MKITAQSIANYLRKPLQGQNITVKKPGSLNRLQPHSVVFARVYSEELIKPLNNMTSILVIADKSYENKLTCSYIVSENPRLDFARLVEKFFTSPIRSRIAETAIIGDDAVIGNNVYIGDYCVIGNNVVIKDNTCIKNHVVIADNTSIGSNCLIKSHSIIGEEGFGFEFDENRIPIRIPHTGSVLIGNGVEVGAGSVIARGTIDNTIIEDNAKIDDQVFIAHNVHIEPNTLIIAGAEISGSVHIGSNCWLGPQCSVINGIKIGSNALIGIGSVVLRPVDDNMIVAGNPASPLRSKG